jgi:hypothetical protein
MNRFLARHQAMWAAVNLIVELGFEVAEYDRELATIYPYWEVNQRLPDAMPIPPFFSAQALEREPNFTEVNQAKAAIVSSGFEGRTRGYLRGVPGELPSNRYYFRLSNRDFEDKVVFVQTRIDPATGIVSEITPYI